MHVNHLERLEIEIQDNFIVAFNKIFLKRQNYMNKILILMLAGSMALIQAMNTPNNPKKRKNKSSQQKTNPKENRPTQKERKKARQNLLPKKAKIVKKQSLPAQILQTPQTPIQDPGIVNVIRQNSPCFVVDDFPYVTAEYYYIDQYDKCQQIVVTKDILAEKYLSENKQPTREELRDHGVGPVWNTYGPAENKAIMQPHIWNNQLSLYHTPKPKAHSTQEDIEEIKNIINTYQERNLQEKIRHLENKQRLQRETEEQLHN